MAHHNKNTVRTEKFGIGTTFYESNIQLPIPRRYKFVPPADTDTQKYIHLTIPANVTAEDTELTTVELLAEIFHVPNQQWIGGFGGPTRIFKFDRTTGLLSLGPNAATYIKEENIGKIYLAGIQHRASSSAPYGVRVETTIGVEVIAAEEE